MEGIDVILLDNMKPAEMREAVALGKKKGVKFEASGGVTLKKYPASRGRLALITFPSAR